MRGHSRWFGRTLAPVLVAALWAAGCSDRGTPAGELLGPDQAAFGKNANNGKSKGRKGVPIEVKGPKGSTTWTLLTGELPANFESSVEGVVKMKGASGKSSDLYLAIPEVGYFLYVPDDAVPAETTFKLKAVKRHAPNGGDPYLAVDLKATRMIDGVEVDVGAAGFLKDVKLGMAYVWSGVTDGRGLQITWVKSYREFREVECHGGFGATCIAQGAYQLKDGRTVGVVLSNLKHFSDYAIGFPN